MVITKKKSYYAINFDLKTDILKKNFGETNYRNAYKKLGKLLGKYGFVHKQGSGYITKSPMSEQKIQFVIASILINTPKIANAIEEIDISEYFPKYSLGQNVKDIFEEMNSKNLDDIQKTDKFIEMLAIFEKDTHDLY